MKNYCRKALVVCALLLALTSSTFADDGVIHTGKTDPEPPPPPPVTGIMHTELSDGVIHTGIVAPDTMTEITLGLLQNLLTLF